MSGNIKQTSGGLTTSGDATVGGDLAVSGETTLDHVIIGDGGQGTRTIGVVDYLNTASCATGPPANYCSLDDEEDRGRAVGSRLCRLLSRP